MIKKLILGIAIGCFAVSCSSDDDATVALSNLNVNLNGLENLGSDFVYEGWIIVNGSPVTTGTFTVDDAGTLSRTSFSVNTDQLASATAFVLSIEPAVDSDPAPAATKLLAGDFSGNTATVGLDPVTSNGNFDNASGVFFLRTPTDEMPGAANNGNDQYGVWYGNPGAPPTSGLNLPPLADGWKYEGWVVVDGTGPLTTGTFTTFGAVDEFNGFSGAENTVGPPIPGEDFFLNAPAGFTFPIDVRGRTVVISVEPSPDNSPAPFLLKPLVGTAGNDTAPATNDFNLNAASFPTGTIVR
ncbi:anti-sigma-K factor rskA [Kordia sp. SMS9]|uniref:anti-sigma factor n=1 Tax=Kordia sp. SMS9 TaxID=2282170 RepID=UPI000E0D80A6|nr:anti-sigma factor [Kordia sp. SMS9]AXG70843.1 anti-sigma-K factor rskA [Kordia sp. SMS9]